MGPGIGFSHLAPRKDVKFLRGGFKQDQLPAFVQGKDTIGLGNHAPVFAETLTGSPLLGARRQLYAESSLAPQLEVSMSLVNDRGGHVALRLKFPCRYRPEATVLRTDIDAQSFSTVGSCEESILPGKSRRKDVHPTEGFDRKGPQFGTILQRHPEESSPRLDHQLAFAGEGEDHGRSEGTAHHTATIPGPVPHHLTIGFAQTSNTSAGLNVNTVAIN